MAENCDLKPGQACQHGYRFDMLEKRVSDLETGQSREEAFRKTYYEDREARLVRDALLDKKIESMDEKLDTLLAYKGEQENKPNKLLDKIRENAVLLVLAALVGAVLGHLGL